MTYREAYETWLKEFADDRATVDELKAIAAEDVNAARERLVNIMSCPSARRACAACSARARTA